MTGAGDPGAAPGLPLPRGTEPRTWTRLVDEVLADPSRLRLVVQPIIGLVQAEIVGYEALSRFDGPTGLTPDRWFAAADRLGRGGELEALALARALELRGSLPPDCFLSVNLSPHLLLTAPVHELLLGQDDLRPLVLELTEHHEVTDLAPVVALRDHLAARGALLALDDAGSGYSGLQQMTRLRPHLIKLDRSLVADADSDEVKLALAELVGQFAGRIDAWLLAEGVETWGEMEAFLRLRVPLAQGYLLGRPAPPWPTLDPATAERLRAGAVQARLVEILAGLVEEVPVQGRQPLTAGRHGLATDAAGVPEAVLVPLHRADDPETHRRVAVSLRAPASAPVVEVLQRAMARPATSRFDPVVVVDGRGAAVGLVRVERLVLRVAELSAGGAPAPGGSPDPALPDARHPPKGRQMKQFSCGDVVPGCGRVFRGTEEEILAQVDEHARADHGMSEVPPHVVEAVRAHLVAL